MQKLLIVEDDPSVRNTMVTVLELEGYSPEAVSSTREAIARLTAGAYPSSFRISIWMNVPASTCCVRRARTILRVSSS